VEQEFAFDGTQVLSHKAAISKGQKSLTVTLMGRILPQDSLMLAMTDQLNHYHLGGTHLRIIQGTDNSGNFDVTQATSSMLRDMYQVTQATITRQQDTIDSLRTANAATAYTDSISAVIAPEVKVLFPQIKDIAVTRAIVSNVETNKLDTLNVVLVKYAEPMGTAQSTKFKEYMQARLRKPSITVVPIK
jgi:hypothetical protein